MTLLKPGKMQELAEEIAKTQIDILAIQEVRWPGKGQIKKKDYQFFYSGTKEKTGQAGTGFLIMKKMQKHIISYELHNERLCKLRIKGKYNNITMINVYAPTEDKTEEIKEQFYDDLQSMVDKVPKSDLIIILGDVNAKLGKEPAYQKITGKHTLHEETNRNGEFLCDFAAANNMIVMSTQFQHKQIHKGTWRSPDHNIINQIDHVLVDQTKKDIIEDVRSLRGPNIDSDHFLVKTTLKQRLPNIYKRKPTPTTKWNKTNLQSPTKLRQYRTLLHNKLENTPDMNNTNEEWERLKETITDAAHEVIQMQSRTPRNEWWDEECRQCTSPKPT
jgi:exonuclease III